MSKTGYVCKECNADVVVTPRGAIARSCAHTGTVLMLLDCDLAGVGSVAVDETPAEAVRRFLQALGAKVLKGLRGLPDR